MHQRASEGQLEESLAIDSGEKKIIGVNCFTDDSYPYEIDGFMGGGDAVERSMNRLVDLRSTRDGGRATDAMKALEAACRSTGNVIPAMLDVLDVDCSIGEVDRLPTVFGDWQSPIGV